MTYRIRHCGGNRNATSYLLSSRHPGFEYQVLLKGQCNRCQQELMAWFGVDIKGQEGTQQRIARPDFEAWEHRRKTEVILQERQGYSPWRETRAMTFVGDWGRLVSRDTAEVYQQVLQRSRSQP